MPQRSQRHVTAIRGSSVFFLPGASADMMFNKGLYYGIQPSALTVTRASVAYAENSGGRYTQFASNAPRITDKGFLIEENRVNSIRNNSMQGAVVGTPGTLPTNWTLFMPAGLSRQIVDVGTDNGIDYIDIRFFGTATGGGGMALRPEPVSSVGASSGQLWTGSIFCRMLSDIGSTSLTDLRVSTLGMDNVPVQVAGADSVNARSLINGGWYRATATVTMTATVVSVLMQITNGTHVYVNGQQYNFTLRFGWPQLEQGGNASSPIRTTTVAVTRNADVVSLPPGALFEGLWNDTTGTLFGEAIPINVPSAAPSRRFVEVSGSTINDRFFIGGAALNVGRGLIASVSGGGTQADISTGTITPNAVNKVAMAWAAGDAQVACNGVLGTADTSVTVPPVDRITFGGDLTGTAGAFLNGYLRRIGIYPTRQTNSQLQSLTR